MSNPRSTTNRDHHRTAIRRTQAPCGICGGVIDYSLPYLDPGSFVVDHVIPLAQGGPDTLDNKQAAHRSCNRDKSDSLVDIPGRRVVLICGPPGAGKTTYAHSLGLQVYDVDDPAWDGNETLFRAALSLLTREPQAQAAVIRSAATPTARAKAARLCGATEVQVITTDLDTCVERIKERKRTDRQPIRAQIAAARDWWDKYEPGDDHAAPTSRRFVTARSW